MAPSRALTSPKSKTSARVRYFVYLVKCADGTLYCGIARNVSARLAEHAAGKGARYTRGRGPYVLLAARRCGDRSLALRIEHAVKQLSRADKLALAANPAGLARLARTALRRRAASKQKRPAHSESRAYAVPSGVVSDAVFQQRDSKSR